MLACVEARAYSSIALEVGERLNAVYEPDHAGSSHDEAIRASGEFVLVGDAIPLEQVAGAVVLQAGVKDRQRRGRSRGRATRVREYCPVLAACL